MLQLVQHFLQPGVQLSFDMADFTKQLSIVDDGATSSPPSEPNNEKYHWYRGVFFQATIVGLCAFAAPGLWNAMSSVGAGGQQTPYLVM